MDPTDVWTFAALSAAIIAVPGPSVLFVVGRALTLGRRGGLLTVVGNAAGAFVQGMLVAVGLGAVVARSITVLAVVRWVGAAYLVWLGVQAIRHRRDATDGDALSEVEVVDGVGTAARVARATPSSAAVLREGFVVGVANPKLVVFFLAFLPQFVTPDGLPAGLQMALLSVVFVAVALVLDSGWAMAAGTARTWLARRPRRLEALGVAGGATMIGLGVHLVVTGRPE